MSMTQNQIVINDIALHLQTFLSTTNIQFSLSKTSFDIEIVGNPNTNNTYTLFYLGVQNGTPDCVDINRLFLSPEDRGNRVGLALIKLSYRVANAYGYETVVSQMTDSFFNYLISKGAKQANPQGDAVQILHSTRI